MPSSSKESNIPVGTGFSPNLINLPNYLKIIIQHSGNVAALESAVNRPPVWIGQKQRAAKRARMHPLEAGVQYGLMTEGTYEATDLARKLATLQEPALYEEFARHILQNLGGLRVIEGAQEMDLDRLTITGDTLARYLTQQGFRVTEHNTAINTMRMWFAKAGLVPMTGNSNKLWLPDLAVKKKLVGLDDDTIATLASFTEEQQAFTLTLCQLEPDDWIPAAEVRDLAESIYGVQVGRGSLPKEILDALQDAGMIEYQASGTQGGKSSRLRTTDKFKAEVLIPFFRITLKNLNPVLTAYYRERPTDIYAALKAKSTDKKGKALEAFTVYIMRLLGLRFVGWRRRAKETAYSEVDVLLGGLFGAMPTTWQVQCKNTPSGKVDLEDIAKEVGLLPLTHATHILVVANTGFTADARKFADETMLKSSVTIFLLDKKDFAEIEKKPASIGRIIMAQAERIRDMRMAEPVWSGIKRPEQPKQGNILFPLN